MKKLFTLLSLFIVAITGFSQENLIISEYVEGTGNNKGIEIYNNTDATVNMSNYWVLRYSNGSPDYTDGGITQLSGELAAHDTYVFVNGQTETNDFSPAVNEDLQAMADKLDGSYPAPMYMNGNDAIALVYSTDGEQFSPVDMFGTIGETRMSDAIGWAPVTDTTVTYTYTNDADEEVEVEVTITDYIVPNTDNSGDAPFGPFWLAWSQNHTLIRKPNVTEGIKRNPDVFNVAEQWDTLPAVYNETEEEWHYADIWTNLGQHEITTTSAKDFNQLDKDMLSVYPNPVTNGSVTVSTPYERNISRIEIMSLLGRTVYKKTGADTRRIHLNPDLAGNQMYLLKVIFEDKKHLVTKILVQ